MQTVRRTSQQERNETPSERADRNFTELVQELRVAQTGVQILFAFLLSLSFLDRFPRDQRTFDVVLTAALLSSAGAALCFMAPVAAHRLHFRAGHKERLVWITHWMAMSGLVLVLAAMDLALWLVIAALWSLDLATTVALVLPVVTLLLWVVLPSWLLSHDRRSADAPEEVESEPGPRAGGVGSGVHRARVGAGPRAAGNDHG
jgi:hypothetical protein